MSSLADASIYANEATPPVAVKTVSSSEVELVDGGCVLRIFYEFVKRYNF